MQNLPKDLFNNTEALSALSDENSKSFEAIQVQAVSLQDISKVQTEYMRRNVTVLNEISTAIHHVSSNSIVTKLESEIAQFGELAQVLKTESNQILK